MNPGNLIFEYFGGMFFWTYLFAGDDGLPADLKIRLTRFYLLDSVGCLDSGLL